LATEPTVDEPQGLAEKEDVEEKGKSNQKSRNTSEGGDMERGNSFVKKLGGTKKPNPPRNRWAKKTRNKLREEHIKIIQTQENQTLRGGKENESQKGQNNEQKAKKKEG